MKFYNFLKKWKLNFVNSFFKFKEKQKMNLKFYESKKKMQLNSFNDPKRPGTDNVLGGK